MNEQIRSEFDDWWAKCPVGEFEGINADHVWQSWRAAHTSYAPREKELERRNAELHKMLREITETARQHSEWMLQSVVERSQAIIAKELATKEPQ